MEALGLDDGFVLAFVQVVLIDLVMSGDNAIIIGLAVAGLPAENRTRIIFWGVVGATVLRMGFATVTTQLLQIIGLTLAGGLLLLWVAWRMFRELRAKGRPEHEHAASTAAPKTPGQAMLQIIAADVSMSLDNVLAVAGAARDHEVVRDYTKKLGAGLIVMGTRGHTGLSGVLLGSVAQDVIAHVDVPVTLVK